MEKITSGKNFYDDQIIFDIDDTEQKKYIKYYITKGPFNYRMHKEPFYTYLKNNEFNEENIKDLLQREKIDYKIDYIKIKNKGEKYFKKVSFAEEFIIKDSEEITLEFHCIERNEKIDKINEYNNEIKKLKEKIKKFSRYDLIYLYASPFFNESEGFPLDNNRIGYREEIKVIYDLVKNKDINCLFECASDYVLRDTLSTKKTKILQISSHGKLVEKEEEKEGKKEKVKYFSLILENLGKCCELQTIEYNTLETYVKFYASQINKIDLIILLNCHSGGFFELIKKYCEPKYIIYIKKEDKISDFVCLLFTKYFYFELINGKSIEQSFNRAKHLLQLDKGLISKFIDGNNTPEKEIEKIQFYQAPLNKDLCLFDPNNLGKLKINENVVVNFNPKKNKSIICRKLLLKSILDILENKINQFIIIYGDSSDKLELAESLCVYLLERKIIDKYIIFNEIELYYINFFKFIESEIKKIKQYCNITSKKIIVLKIKKEDLISKIEKIVENFNEYKEFFFIIIIDIEVKEKLKNKYIDEKYILNDKIKYFEAKVLFKELCKHSNVPFKDSFLGNLQDKEHKFQDVVDLFNKYIDPERENVINKNQNEDIIINFSTKPLHSYLFVLSQMPLGLPDSFVKIIFNQDFNDNLISKFSMNNWNYINTHITFKNKEKFEEYTIKYILKILRLYCKVLYFNIEKNRDEIIHPDEKIHFIFNSYNNEGIWKSKVPNIKDGESINENVFISNDFNIKDHRQNIYNLINYLINKLEFFDEQYINIEYLSEILLLFPSYFFPKKICKNYIIKCKEFCEKCQKHFAEKLNPNPNSRIENKLNIQININNIDNEDIKLKLEKINEQRKQLSEQIKNFRNSYEKWKENHILIEPKKIFEIQNWKLSLFLYSITSDFQVEENLKRNSEFNLELNIINFLKDKNNENTYIILKEISNNNNSFLSKKRKAKLLYEIASKYYSDNKLEYSDYLNEALNLKIDKFIEIRINIDFCYMFLKEHINKNEENVDIYPQIQERIYLLEKLKEKYQFKFYNEVNHLLKKYYELIEPNVIMLNANPLNNGYSILNSGIYTYPNNQYYILEKLNKLNNLNNIQSSIILKSYILNEENLNEVLRKTGDILIIQSDDFTEDGDIVLETEDGKSNKLNKEKILDDLNGKFKIIILCFLNGKNLYEMMKNKIKFEYLIYFDKIDISKLNEKYFQYNKFCIDFIIKFISCYNEDRVYDDMRKLVDEFNEKLKKSKDFKDFPKCQYIRNENCDSTITNNKINIKKEIFFLDSFLNLQMPHFLKDYKINDYMNFSTEMLDVIKEIKKGNNKWLFCNHNEKKKYIKMGFEIIKYFFCHKTFMQYCVVDVEYNSESQLIKEENQNKFGKKIGENKYFYLVYNCRYYNSFDVLNYLLDNKCSYIIIFDGDSYINNINNEELTTKGFDSDNSLDYKK